VANLDERQPLIDDDAHQLLGRDEQSTNGRKFQGASKKVRVEQSSLESSLILTLFNSQFSGVQVFHHRTQIKICEL
jgi:hypothetical protein